MKKLIIILLLIPLFSLGQNECLDNDVFAFNSKDIKEEAEGLRTEYKRSEQFFKKVIKNFYTELNFLCSNKCKEKKVDIPFAEVPYPPKFLQCFFVNDEDSRDCFADQISEHIRQNLSYPKIAQEMGIQGRVYINFVIDQCGYVSDIRMRGPDENLEKEAYRIISLLPRFLPGRDNFGMPVLVPFSIPITFRLN